MSGSAFAVTHHAFSSGAGRTSDGNGSHASTLKSPSYTKSVSWQHYPPPLFAMKGKKENTLRILDATNNQLPQDRESLFWMNVKAIPSMDKSKLTENTLQLAIISRIKLYYRPAKLALPPDQAAEKLRFRRSANSLTLINPTPYYLTVTELNAGTRVLENALVPPMGESAVKLPSDAGSNITYRTINDYGALTPKMTGVME